MHPAASAHVPTCVRPEAWHLGAFRSGRCSPRFGEGLIPQPLFLHPIGRCIPQEASQSSTTAFRVLVPLPQMRWRLASGRRLGLTTGFPPYTQQNWASICYNTCTHPIQVPQGSSQHGLAMATFHPDDFIRGEGVPTKLTSRPKTSQSSSGASPRPHSSIPKMSPS